MDTSKLVSAAQAENMLLISVTLEVSSLSAPEIVVALLKLVNALPESAFAIIFPAPLPAIVSFVPST